MPAIVVRNEGQSTFRPTCAEHRMFKGMSGSMRFALRQAEGHNRVMHPEVSERDTVASALRARKES